MLDSGDAAGRLWFTMPFVEGESLRDRLRRERQLPVDDALRIAREAAVNFTGVSPLASTFSIARSNLSWTPTIFASRVLPSGILQVTLPGTSLYFVRT